MIIRTCLSLGTALLFSLLCACVPTGDQHVNTELFKNQEDMQKKAASLKPGMRKKKVFKTLGIDPARFSRMSTAEVQMSLYGNSQVQGTPAQLEKFRKKLMQCSGYSLPYSDIKSDSSLGFGTMKIEKTGYNLKLVLIFRHNKLVQSSVEGTQKVKEEQNRYLWDTLLRRGIGLPF